MKIKFSTLLLISSILLFSCKSKKTASDVTTKSEKKIESITNESMPAISKDANSLLLNKDWKLTELFGEPISIAEEGMEIPSINLGKKGQFKGSGGCNSMFGSYSLKDKNFIKFSDISMTEKACGTPNYDEKLEGALRTAEQFIVIGEDEFHLVVGKRAPLAKFKIQ